MKRIIVSIIVVSFVFVCFSCGKDNSVEGDGDAKQLVVYFALDSVFSEPIFELFEKKTGIKVRAKFDDELTKTTGLVNKIIGLKGKQEADVFWNNEIVQTLKLKQNGLTQSCKPENAKKIPAEFKDKECHWYGFAARARVILVNKKRFKEKFGTIDYPSSFWDILDPKWGKEAAIAKPLFGTTATHAATLRAYP